MPKSQRPRKKYRPRPAKPQGVRDPWPLEGEVLAAIQALALDAATVRTFDILIPWLMLVHRVAKMRDDLATGRVVEGAFRTCDEIVSNPILLPSVVTSDDPGLQRIHVTNVQRTSLTAVLPTLVVYLNKAKNLEIMEASSQLMKEYR